VLLGRDRERAACGAAVTAARTGRGAALTLVGGAGLGLTALLDHTARRSPDAFHLRLAGITGERNLPWSAVCDLVTMAQAHLPSLPATQRLALGGLLLGQLAVGTSHLLIVRSLLALLVAVSRRRPTMVLVDDLQSMDQESRRALTYLARRVRQQRLAVILATHEPSEDLADLPTLQVQPFDCTQSTRLLEHLNGRSVPPDVALRLFQAARGTPGRLVELVEALPGGALSGDAPLPNPLPTVPGVRRAFAEAVRSLSAEEFHTLVLIALQPEAPLPTAWSDALRNCLRRGLLVETPEGLEPADPLLPGLLADMGGRLLLTAAAGDAGSATLVDVPATTRGLPPAGAIDRLTAQEQRIATAVTDGAANAEIAASLGVSVKTVEYHLHNIYTKLGVHSRVQLLRQLMSPRADEGSPPGVGG
jgi:DNA-binding CsgD family transcriptional regulator